MNPPTELLTPLHLAAYRLYVLRIEGEGNQPQRWLSLTAAHQNLLVQDLIDLINRQQKLSPPLTMQNAHSHPLPTKDHKTWQKTEISHWRKKNRRKN